jgi:hypothetical protein
MSEKKHALLLTHGAGGDIDEPSLVEIQGRFLARGWPVCLFRFPYKQAGRRAPDRPPVLLESLIAGVREFSRETGAPVGRIVIGGRSMGGRICSIAASEGLDVAGLLLISYPLHPPGRPDRLRVEHLPTVKCPTLFVSGTTDAFGSPDALWKFARRVSGPVEVVHLEPGDHSLKGWSTEIADAAEQFVDEYVLISK